MKKFGIFFGSSTGTTEEVAHKIAGLLKIDSADVHNVATTAPDAVGRLRGSSSRVEHLGFGRASGRLV